MPAEPVKCVVWDLDGTIWRGVAVEAPAGRRPEPIPRARRAIETLERRGILNSLASRTDPSVAALVDGDPELAGRFVAAQLGWGHKSDAIRRIAAELGIDPAAIAFVDDDPFERAEVAASLPAVLVLSPDELYEQLDTPRFRPAVVTEDGRRRLARYQQERRRRGAQQTFAGNRDEFLRQCRIRLSVAPAEPSDLDRLAELVARTHRFNSTGAQWSRDRLAGLIGDDGWLVPVARLVDRFGDYGLIGAALVEWALPAPRLHLFMVSCRAVGRGAPAAFLGWILARARAAGAGRMLMDVRQQQANLELRVLLRRIGFDGSEDAGLPERRLDPDLPEHQHDTGLLERRLDPDLPQPPEWLTVVDGFAHFPRKWANLGTGLPSFPESGGTSAGNSRSEARSSAIEGGDSPVKAGDSTVEAAIRELLGAALGVEQAAVDRLPASADLLHGPLPLTSLAGARLLAAIRGRFGVDVAAEDLALDSLRSIATLRDFITARSGGSAATE